MMHAYALLERSVWNLFLEIPNMALPATWIMLAVLLFRILLKKKILKLIQVSKNVKLADGEFLLLKKLPTQ